jgi:hypothetical protein
MQKNVEIKFPDNFEQENHFYPKALNAQLHPMVGLFFNLDHERIINRYIHLHPAVNEDMLRTILKYKAKHFFWGGADLFYVTTERGNRKMVVLETNSCPSGQKSMPPKSDFDDHRGYRLLLESSFLPELKQRELPAGALAVIYDKNYMETSGYAQTLADLTGEEVYLIPHMNNDRHFITFIDGVMNLKTEKGERIPIRAAFRYVTQTPWNRLPVQSKTFIYNSTLVCLSGGRNKLVANKAYELYNSELAESGLKINTPETIKDVSKLEVPLWVQKFGGKAVIKNPYSNAGQGVYTVTSESELAEFMQQDYPYDQFIVQSLIGHYNWSSLGQHGRYYHIGTVPNKKGNIYIADIRVMVCSSENGFIPCAIYARRAKTPLEDKIQGRSWDVLGTNLSMKTGENQWETDTNRLLLMDKKDFNNLGVGIDDLIEAYIQTVLTVVAVDKMAQKLITKDQQFDLKLFQSLDHDDVLINEIMV